MKKMVILLTLLIPATSLGAPIDTWIDEVIEYAGSEIKTDKSNIDEDRRNRIVKQLIEYETSNKKTNPALINAYAVNQEKLDMYRAAHPRFNFPEHIKELSRAQAKQILGYFWDNYRFSDYKYDEILEQVWDMLIHMSMADLDIAINSCIRKYYDFDDSYYAPFGSIASVQLLNGMAPKNVPEFWKILNEVKY